MISPSLLGIQCNIFISLFYPDCYPNNHIYSAYFNGPLDTLQYYVRPDPVLK